jgi:hypothetical protein
MRAVVRSTVLAGLTGTMMLGAAWAGIGIAPPPVSTPPVDVKVPVSADAPTAGTDVTAAAGDVALPFDPSTLAGGQMLVGAAKTSMYPRPEDYPGAKWEKDMGKCNTEDPAWYQDLMETMDQEKIDHLASTGSPWPENPNCIYQGGFGLGPANPVKEFDTEFGLWVRSVALSDGQQTLVLTVIDGEGWLWDYQNKCADCGAKQIAQALASDPDLSARGVHAGSHILHATHSHASPDFIGGWGFVPDWYMKQITESIKSTVKQAVMTMEAAKLEAGEQEARRFNSERRDTYRSAEEAQLSWLRAIAVDNGATVATVGAYAAHPTSYGNNNGIAHPDWVGGFEKRLEERFGGIGLHFMTGLGNLSNAGGRSTGVGLADLLPPVGMGRPVTDTTVKIVHTTVTSALTNVPLTALGTPGFFDRKFTPTPAVVSVGESAEAPCVSASPQSVELPVSAARIGNDLVFTAAPGEVFANYTNTVKEKNVGRITFPMAQSNDALGYMPQSFEINPVGQQGLGFAAGGYVFVNYEDSYAIDRCVGDLMLETTLKLMSAIR